jgi:alpha-glucosidase
MPWHADPKGGFTRGEPWLPLNVDVATRNVEMEKGDPLSILSLYRRLLALRKEEAALAVGSIEEVAAEGPVLRYVRREGSRKFAVALNLAAEKAAITLGTGTVILSTLAWEGGIFPGELEPNEAVIVRLDPG